MYYFRVCTRTKVVNSTISHNMQRTLAEIASTVCCSTGNCKIYVRASIPGSVRIIPEAAKRNQSWSRIRNRVWTQLWEVINHHLNFMTFSSGCLPCDL
jgi:hypothetical protein